MLLNTLPSSISIAPKLLEPFKDEGGNTHIGLFDKNGRGNELPFAHEEKQKRPFAFSPNEFNLTVC